MLFMRLQAQLTLLTNVQKQDIDITYSNIEMSSR